MCTYIDTTHINRRGQKIHQTSLESQSSLGPSSNGGSGVLFHVSESHQWVPSWPFPSCCSGWGEEHGRNVAPTVGSAAESCWSLGSSYFLAPRCSSPEMRDHSQLVQEHHRILLLKTDYVKLNYLWIACLKKKSMDNQIWCGCRCWLMLLPAGHRWGD